MIKVEEIRKKTNKARELMSRARTEKFAVGAFNIDNQETLIAVARAAADKKSPVMVELSQDEVNLIGLKNMRCMVDNYIEEYGIEMYINLDHSPTVEASKQAIDAGFEFIHIDISQANREASDEEIIEKTQLVVDYAKKTGAIVESEPHYFGGSSNVHDSDIDYEEIKKTFTTPEQAAEFVRVTGIDTFAVAIGNLHGRYPVPKILDIELLKRVRASVDCNLSLHGGSGTSAEYFRQAIENGITKVNINSDSRYAYRTALEKTLSDNPSQFAVIKIIQPVISAVQRVVEEKIDMFGSAGKQEV
jgi:fructose-bisphosphate aldolase, class II